MSVTSPESGFTPRREFLRDHPVTPNAFSLLAIAGTNCIRLYSFPLPLMTALRRLLDQQKLVVSFREDIDQQLCEIALGGKPWTNAKSLSTEKLLIEILAVTMAVNPTTASPWHFPDPPPLLPSVLSLPLNHRNPPPCPSGPQNACRLPCHSRPRTMLRVIAPPLHSTPAILQAVRSSWPRGVVSEKKVGDNCFEFKLKGYKWFHEDTFATDSLRYILNLLSSLDAHSFTLLSSVTLTNRSRVKDLWIFTGPATSSLDSLPESPAPSILSASHSEFKRAVPGLESQFHNPSSHSLQHRRLASEPSPQPHVQQGHVRAATDSPHRPVSVLRKPAPRAQHDEQQPNETSFPLILPVGEATTSRSPTPQSRGSSSQDQALPLTPPLVGSQSPSSTSSPHHTPTPPTQSPDQVLLVNSEPTTPGTPPLLSPNAFRDSVRDSAFSSNTSSMYDIPIKWTGDGRDSRVDTTAQDDERASFAPDFPGGWQPTPIEEKPEDTGAFGEPLPVPEEEPQTPDATESQDPDQAQGKGWVVVDVEGKGDEATKDFVSPVISQSPEPLTPASPVAKPFRTTPTISPAAKAIAIVDAIEAKNKSKSPSSETPSGIKKFFSMSRKHSNPPSPTASVKNLNSETRQASKLATEVSVEDTKRAIELVSKASGDEKPKPTGSGGEAEARAARQAWAEELASRSFAE
ncbi:hypothetical protein C8J57DRAFT_1210877 [Mycena rebaudengoi]|nr:hypothetical protein C8J57DRAFT_1210877 [Mycena rebaudengoi]